MNRSDNDTWDLATSVGATATMVAAARAVATRQADAIINDPFAEPLVRAAGVELFARLASGDLEFADIETPWMMDYFAVRTRFFDGFFSTALSAGIRQAVIIGSGLDSRAYRLEWPPGSIAYEIDQPEVIEFKDSILTRLGATPATQLCTVGIDLRRDWPAALRQAGFDPVQPTAWLAEGLMIGYLPSDAQNRMLDQLTALSAPGSRLAADHVTKRSGSIGSNMRHVAATWKRHGFDVDFGDLTYPHERNDVDKYLQARGWYTRDRGLVDLLAADGVPGGARDTVLNVHDAIHYLTATRN
ncbi:SAM-dependent methyltransferase [Mycobacterium alsense]|uniref:S-adenosyl-L-methionine-dependent methyltransferase n=1 Tax=Mycobacterium alsense TaxID=324058 RepID=A0AA41XQ31_9MYCO|nr:SAM-dependent methyltransferase [Mycobacterium alsense]MCV7379174.1 SAM-dependent methyltransferase [Mycobacterium alsense]OQZ89848.1 SAM-dependent methyltransferase [Mycobacterium alsense]